MVVGLESVGEGCDCVGVSKDSFVIIEYVRLN